MAYLAIGVIALLLVLLLGRAFVNANPASLARGARWGLGLAAVLVLVILLATEQLGPALALTGGLIGVILRGRALWQHARFAGGPQQPGGRVSEVETATLRMTLDHDSGAMDGTIRRGRHQGRRLTELSEGELMALWRECRADDAEAAKLLETYLDRAAPRWRDGGARGEEAGAGGTRGRGADPGAAAGAMTREEARAILEVAAGATRDEIKAAHRRLMMKLHPDHGGSTYLAMRVNQAKDLLLGDLK
jgi:hypothetical protein